MPKASKTKKASQKRRLSFDGRERKLVDPTRKWTEAEWKLLAAAAAKLIVDNTTDLCKHPAFERWRQSGNMQRKVRKHAEDLVSYYNGTFTLPNNAGKGGSSAQVWSLQESLILAEECCQLILMNAQVLCRLPEFENWLPGENTQRKVRQVAESMVNVYKTALGIETLKPAKTQRKKQTEAAIKAPQKPASQASPPESSRTQRVRASRGGKATQQEASAEVEESQDELEMSEPCEVHEKAGNGTEEEGKAASPRSQRRRRDPRSPDAARLGVGDDVIKAATIDGAYLPSNDTRIEAPPATDKATIDVAIEEDRIID